MNRKIAGIVARIAELEQELDQELAREFREDRQEVHGASPGKENLPPHRTFRQGIFSYLRETPPRFFFLAPVFYSFYLPLLLLDLWIWIFQTVFFPACGIPKVKRSLYVILDRGQLPYLNWIEQFNCNYCGYTNGLIAYAREVAARTEQYFCPIKHAHRIPDAHSRYHMFFNFDDGEGYRQGYQDLRDKLKK